MKAPHDLILAPVVSEKSYDLIENENIYTFEVDPRSNKEEIRDAIDEVFEVTVIRVNTMNRKGKRKRSGFTFGKRKDVKRAIVKIAEGDSIDLFGV